MEYSADPDHFKLSVLHLHCFSKEDIPGFSQTV